VGLTRWREPLAALLWGALPALIAVTGMSPLLQATAVVNALLALLWLWTRVRDIPVFAQDETLRPGAWLGAAFSARIGLYYVAAVTLGALPTVLACCALPLLARAVAARAARRAGFVGLALLAAAGAWGGAAGHALALGLALAAGAAWVLEDRVARAPALARCGAERFVFYRLIGGAVTLPVASVVAGENWLLQPGAHAWALLTLQIALALFALLLRWGRNRRDRVGLRASLAPPVTLGLSLVLHGWPGELPVAAALLLAFGAAIAFGGA
jgi:hypothetical protein